MLKQRIANHQPQLLDYRRVLNTMHSQDVRQRQQQQLYEEYRKVSEKAKEDMMTLYLSSAEAQMHHYHDQFNTEMKQFWNEQRTLPTNQKFTGAMLNVLTQRYNNISESIDYVYKYKARYIHSKSVDASMN